MMKEAAYLREAPKHAPEEVKQAYGILEKHKWTRLERLAYEQAKIGLMDDLEAIRTARVEGMAEGRTEGKAAMLLEIMRIKFKIIPEQLESAVMQMNVDELSALSSRILDAKTLKDIFLD